MRRSAGVAALLLAVCTLFASTLTTSVAADPTSTAPTLEQCQNLVKKQVLTSGHLTVATDNPVYAPWFIKDNPSNQQGYESAVAYLLAGELGFAPSKLKWVVEPFADSFAPGNKPFDFDINEIVSTPDRASNVTFSSSYYDVQQSIVAMKSAPIVSAHSPHDLIHYRYGALAASPALTYVTKYIKPTAAVTPFINLSDMVTALENNTINAIVIDVPTGNFEVNFQIQDAGGNELATQVGQFPNVHDEHYGLVFAKNNPLVACVNVAIAVARANGKFASLKSKWLTVYNKIPTIKP